MSTICLLLLGLMMLAGSLVLAEKGHRWVTYNNGKIDMSGAFIGLGMILTSIMLPMP